MTPTPTSRRRLQRASRHLVCLVLLGAALAAPAMAEEKVEIAVDVSQTGVKIDRNIFGQFASSVPVGHVIRGSAASTLPELVDRMLS